MVKIGIIGTTSWGTTLAILLARQGLDIRLWARSDQEASILRSQGENSRFVPGAKFPPTLSVTASQVEAFHQTDMVIIAVPSQTLRENVQNVCGYITGSPVILSAVKGLEMKTGKRMSQILDEEMPLALSSNICVLSGPNLAGEIISGKPSSTVVASNNQHAARRVQSIITSPYFRVYTNDDIVGVELGGALKNIIAIGTGICDGLQYGNNSKAVFMTRGLAEIARLGIAAGASPLTFSGLAGMGDLVTTCSSTMSRNHRVGKLLAGGRTLDEVRGILDNVAEGIDTTSAAVSLASQLGVEMPIVQATHNVLFNCVPIRQAISDLLERDPKLE